MSDIGTEREIIVVPIPARRTTEPIRRPETPVPAVPMGPDPAPQRVPAPEIEEPEPMGESPI